MTDARLTDHQLQTLIEEQPDTVLECLAGKIGLDYPSIRSRLSRTTLGKRRSDSKSHDMATRHDDDPHKRQKRLCDVSGATEEINITEVPPATLVMSSFMRQLVKDPEERSPTSVKSSEGHVSWARSNDPRWKKPLASHSSQDNTLLLSVASDENSRTAEHRDAHSDRSTE